MPVVLNTPLPPPSDAVRAPDAGRGGDAPDGQAFAGALRSAKDAGRSDAADVANPADAERTASTPDGSPLPLDALLLMAAGRISSAEPVPGEPTPHDDLDAPAGADAVPPGLAQPAPTDPAAVAALPAAVPMSPVASAATPVPSAETAATPRLAARDARVSATPERPAADLVPAHDAAPAHADAFAATLARAADDPKPAASSPAADAASAAQAAAAHLRHADAATASHAPAATATVQTSVHAPGFANDAAQTIAQIVTRGHERAELKLSPVELGPVEVRIEIRNHEASLTMVAPLVETRDALEQSLPQLRDMLAAQGIALTDASVQDGRADPSSGRNASDASPRGEREATAEPAPARRVTIGSRLVDVFA